MAQCDKIIYRGGVPGKCSAIAASGNIYCTRYHKRAADGWTYWLAVMKTPEWQQNQKRIKYNNAIANGDWQEADKYRS